MKANKITNWIKADEVSEEGLYLVCNGDVETYYNIDTEEFTKTENGNLVDHCRMPVLDPYYRSRKFAKLEF